MWWGEPELPLPRPVPRADRGAVGGGQARTLLDTRVESASERKGSPEWDPEMGVGTGVSCRHPLCRPTAVELTLRGSPFCSLHCSEKPPRLSQTSPGTRSLYVPVPLPVPSPSPSAPVAPVAPFPSWGCHSLPLGPCRAAFSPEDPPAEKTSGHLVKRRVSSPPAAHPFLCYNRTIVFACHLLRHRIRSPSSWPGPQWASGNVNGMGTTPLPGHRGLGTGSAQKTGRAT